MLLRPWLLPGTFALALITMGCTREPASTVSGIGTAGGEAAPSEPDSGPATDASFGVPTDLPSRAPAAGDAWWAEAVASCFAAAEGYPVQRQRPAPNALLAFGNDPARAALYAILDDPEPRTDDEMPFTHRFMAAWCLAEHDLDYDRGREIILRYLRAMCEPDYIDPDIGRKLNSPEEYAYAAARLYEHSRDPELLQGVLTIAPCSDGALSEGLTTTYLRLALGDLNGFLAVLSECTREQTEKVSEFMAEGLRDRGGRSSEQWTELVGPLEVTARSPQAPYRDTARDVLVYLNRHLSE